MTSGGNSSFWGPSSSSSSRRTTDSSRADSTLNTKVNRGGTTQSRGEAVDSRQSTSPVTGGGPATTSTSPNSSRGGIAGQRSSIPQSVQRPDGSHSPVYMDQSRGGSGFWDSAGKWILISSLLNSGGHAGYQPHYGAAAANPGAANSAAPDSNRSEQSSSDTQRSRSGGGGFAFVGLIVLVILVIVGIQIFRMSRAPRPGQNADAHLAALGRAPGPRADPTPRTALARWLALQPGSFVTLSDEQAIEDSQKRGGGVHGIDYTVEQVGIAKDFDGFATWVLAQMNDGHQRLLLMVKGDDAHVEHRVYYASEDFQPARREAVLSRGDQWLFETPANAANPDPARLRYAAEIPYSIGGAELVYVRKDHGERHCEYVEKPELSGFGAQVATVAEYRTSDPTDNPELLILEIATAQRKTGEVSLYFGAPVRASEIDIVKTAAAHA